MADVHYGAEIIQNAGRRWRALTLTTSYDSDQSLMGTYFSRFRAYLANYGVRGYEYFKVTEFTESGLRHFHIAISAFVPFNLIQAAWRAATNGTAYRVFIQKAQIRSVAGYFLKYITKSLQHEHRFNKGERRYSFSKNFPRIEKVRPDPGRFEFLSFVDYMYECLANGTWYENDRVKPDDRIDFNGRWVDERALLLLRKESKA